MVVAAAQARPTAITGKVALLVQDASEDIMEKYRFLTIEETDEVLVYDNGVYRSGGKTLIAKELEASLWLRTKHAQPEPDHRPYNATHLS